MKTWQKVGIGVGAVVVLGGIVLFSVNQANKGVVTVQTAKVAPQETLISQVTASGEVKPTTYTNVTAQGFGRITSIVVKEGDHIKKGDVLLTQENIQANADVQAQAAAINSAESGVQASEASYKSAQSDLLAAQANLEKAKLDWERGQGLFKDGLIPKQDFDQRKTAYDAQFAAVDSSKARVLSLKATLDQMRAQVSQGRAVLVHTQDILHKTTYTSPINGIVSYLPERVGDYVVPGIQNSNGSFLMTLSDMSIVTAEVKVDETDIVNVKIGQDADVTIDAVPGKIFKGKSHGNWLAGRPAHFGTGDDAIDHQQPGSERFQSGRDAWRVRRKICGRPVDHREDQDRRKEKCVGDSHSGAGGAHAQGSRRSREESKGSSGVTLAAPPPPRAGRSEEGRNSGRFRGQREESDLPPRGNRHLRRHRHRNHQGPAAGRRDRRRQLQGSSHAQARGQREGRQLRAEEDRRPAELTHKRK